MDDTIILANAPPKMRLECPHCGIVKRDIEEIEIHLKMDHISWLPFQCKVCNTIRATDGQMREHVFAAHKAVTDTQFFYNDNKDAKKDLQQLLHKALFLGIKREATACVQAGTPEAIVDQANPYPDGPEIKDEKGPDTVVKEESATPQIAPQPSDQKANLQLFHLLFPQDGVQAEENMEEQEDRKMDDEDGVANIMGMINAQLAMQNMAMMFPATLPTIPEQPKRQRKAKVKCAGCGTEMSPSTRGLHTYFHLQNDYKEPRFRCLIDNCNAVSHKKDTIETHLHKLHNTNNLEFMEDRMAELNDLFKKVHAQLFPDQTTPASLILDEVIAPESAPDKQPSPPGARPAKIKPCFCTRCGDFYDEKERGEHVRWHLFVVHQVAQFACTYCGFKHQEGEEVFRHAELMHAGMKDAVADTVNDHLDELERIANDAFGIPYLAACHLENQKDASRRRSVRRSSILKGRKRVASEPTLDESGETAKQTKTDGGSEEYEDETKKERGDKLNEKMRLTDISRILGGCHYLTRTPGATHEVCAVCQVSRKIALPEHAYIHMDHPPFACPFCDTHMAARKAMVTHIRDVHSDMESHPIDNRLKYAVELKETIRKCYPTIFTDGDTPTNKDLGRLSRGADDVALRQNE